MKKTLMNLSSCCLKVLQNETFRTGTIYVWKRTEMCGQSAWIAYKYDAPQLFMRNFNSYPRVSFGNFQHLWQTPLLKKYIIPIHRYYQACYFQKFPLYASQVWLDTHLVVWKTDVRRYAFWFCLYWSSQQTPGPVKWLFGPIVVHNSLVSNWCDEHNCGHEIDCDGIYRARCARTRYMFRKTRLTV